MSIYSNFSLIASCAGLSLALLITRPVAAQNSSPTNPPQPDAKKEKAKTKVYTRAEQMPQLPGGGDAEAIAAAIQNKVVYPQLAVNKRVMGYVFVKFTVGPDGLVRDINVVKGIGSGCDEAVVTAVQQLPKLEPGRQRGEPVAVRITLPVVFRLAGPPTAPAHADSATKIYTYIERMPELPSGDGEIGIIKTAQRALELPEETRVGTTTGMVYVAFTVSPSGIVRDAKVVKSLSPACDAAALTAVYKLPRFFGGQQNGRPVSVSYTIPLVFERK